MQNLGRIKMNWNGCLSKNFFKNLFLSFNFNQKWTYLHRGSVSKCKRLYHPVPKAMDINAFSISWQDESSYVFPPFAVIGNVLHKIDVLDVVPTCPTQRWYSLLINLLIDIPILLHSSKTILQDPVKSKLDPLINKLTYPAWVMSGKNQEQKILLAERIRIIQQSRRLSTTKDITTTLENGKCFYWLYFNIFRSNNWIPNQNLWIRCWVLINRYSKISPVIWTHHGHWNILWKISP